MKIRLATLSDTQTIADIHTTAWCTAFGGYVTPEILANMRNKDRTEMTTAAIKERRTWVAEEDGRLLGFATITPLPASELKLLYVHPDHQRRSIGSQLFQTVRHYFKEQGVQTFVLWTMKNYPTANRFYTRLGGHPTGNELRLKINLDTVEYRFNT